MTEITNDMLETCRRAAAAKLEEDNGANVLIVSAWTAAQLIARLDRAERELEEARRRMENVIGAGEYAE